MVQLEKRGFFITFEGGEGAGKSTQCRMLVDALEHEGISCLLTREPGGSVGAEEIRKLLVTGDVGRWDALTEILLFSAARRDHLVKTIWPALKNGTVVICDRFVDSTMAYQGYGYGDNPEIQEKMKKTNLRKYGTEHVLQADDAVDPVFALYFPAGQFVHFANPVDDPYVPAGHDLHEDCPVLP